MRTIAVYGNHITWKTQMIYTVRYGNEVCTIKGLSYNISCKNPDFEKKPKVAKLNKHSNDSDIKIRNIHILGNYNQISWIRISNDSCLMLINSGLK